MSGRRFYLISYFVFSKLTYFFSRLQYCDILGNTPSGIIEIVSRDEFFLKVLKHIRSVLSDGF
jgi:hypothetical protein